MKVKGLIAVGMLVAGMLVTSCEKADIPVVLPEKGEAEYAIVEMGEEYTYQLFYDFETASVVNVSRIDSWDLAFDASPDGIHVFMNGGSDVLVYNTHEKDFHKVTKGLSRLSDEWEYDAPCLLKDSTAIGDWTDGSNLSKGEVYVIQLNPTNNANYLKKIRLVTVSSTEYVMEYGDIEDQAAQVIRIPKDERYTYAYFSFKDGGKVVQPDPPKDTWDIVFTRYRHIYRHLDNFKYIVSGVLLNPYKTSAFEDSTKGYAAIEGDWIIAETYSNHRDVIGFDWKKYDLDKGDYSVNQDKTFVIKNRRNHYWKLHFLDFYNAQGIKGSPSFEFERLY